LHKLYLQHIAGERNRNVNDKTLVVPVSGSPTVPTLAKFAIFVEEFLESHQK